MTQIDLIGFHGLIQDEARECDSPRLSAHYAHLLMALQALIESHGPTQEYCQWSVQFSPGNTSNQCTFVIDL
jgi:hypothetical protein